MNRIIKRTTTALDRAQSRFCRSRLTLEELKISRRGSVLIIVVALLVLMAIIGTAYISTARTDRGAAASNAENVEGQLLLQGVEDMATSQIVADIDPYIAADSGTRFRTANTNYVPYNSASIDSWLADRVPVALDSTVYESTGGNPPVWRFLSIPPINLFTDPTTGATYGGGYTVLPTSPAVPPPSAPGTSTSSATRCDYQPTYATVNGVVYPALEYFEADKGVFSAPFVAADTDGDGVADAGLFRLPCGEINGVTYYGAYRIVDNNAAINASVAWAPQAVTPSPPAPTPITTAYLAAQQTLPGNFFPVNVDLADLLCSGDSLTTTPTAVVPGYSAFYTSLNGWRYGGSSPSTTPTSGSGYVYQTGYDAAWHELGRRLQNPGSTTFQSLTLADSAAMAHRFVIRDPNAAPSYLEQALPYSTGCVPMGNPAVPAAPTQPYPFTINGTVYSIPSWFNSNFNYGVGNQASAFSLRALLVGRNGVSNFVQSKFGPTVAPVAGTNPTGAPLPGAPWTTNFSTSFPGTTYSSYTFGDWVTYNNHAYVCVQPNTPSAGNAPSTTVASGSNYYTDNAYWVYEPWYNAPAKTNVNTATFGQLWLAYWEVMSDQQNTAPAGSFTGNIGTNMFRSSLRYPSSPTPGTANAALSATQELQLRAAIAAVNTFDLRNTSLAASTNATNVFPSVAGAPAPGSPLQIENYASGAPAAQYGAVVYGTKPQPYITEVYADNDPTLVNNSVGYVAVQLYNPYPYPITLTNWVLVTIPRANTPGTALVPTVIPSTVTGWATGASATTLPTIPANGFCVLANAPTPGGYTTPPTATVGSTTDPLYVVPGLEAAFGNDLVLMRPTVAGTYSGSATSLAANDFTTAAPVDSYDFTGLNTQTVFASNTCYEWTYYRDTMNANPANANTTNAWHFIYPGAFDPTRGANGREPRFLGTNQPMVVATAGTPPTTTLASLGAPHTQSTGYTDTIDFPTITAPIAYNSLPIQLNNVDFGGPVKLTSGTNNFPFGEFPRNGDVTQVPFIGAYKIYDSTGANLLEMNPVTLDAAYSAWTVPVAPATVADETAAAGTTQNIGRFAPWYNVDYTIKNLAGTGTPYGWATRLMDYLTVQAPADDYAPDTDPVQYLGVAGSTPVGVANSKPTIVNAVTGNPGSLTEDTVPVQGLININTAPWRVLASLPFSDDPNTNAALAQAIVNWRDGYWGSQLNTPSYVASNGPFPNVFALNAVSAAYNSTQISLPVGTTATTPLNFLNTLGSYYTIVPPATTVPPGTPAYANAYTPSNPSHAPTNNDGMLTPLYATAAAPANNWPTTSGVVNDFQTWNLGLARVSNLITTRSDSYTVYVTVQGWANVGSTNSAKPPTLVVQRRAAFIVDRSGTTPANPTVSVTNVSTN